MCCSQCGNTITSNTAFCTQCGCKLEAIEQSKVKSNEHHTVFSVFKTHKKFLIIDIAVICFIGYFFGIRCKSDLCMLPNGFTKEYCSLHTCEKFGCTNKKATNKEYCYTHLPMPSSGITYTPESADNVLVFSNVEITHNSSYTICTGRITNKGKNTYSFVKVKGTFENSWGNVLETDWTYAVGSEGLAPGESTTFRISVDKNLNIKKCTPIVFDWEKE